MTAKEYLNRAQNIKRLIDCRQREIEYWQDIARSISASNFEPHYNATRSTSASYERAVEKVDEIQRSIDDKIIELVATLSEVNGCIDQLDREEEQILLRCRYVDNLSWQEIGELMQLSKSSLFRIHDSALKKIRIP